MKRFEPSCGALVFVLSSVDCPLGLKPQATAVDRYCMTKDQHVRPAWDAPPADLGFGGGRGADALVTQAREQGHERELANVAAEYVDHPVVSLNALEALVEMESDLALGTARKLASHFDDDIWLSDVAELIGKLPAAEITPLLIQIAESGGRFAPAAATEQLAERLDPGALAWFRVALRDGDWHTARLAVDGLGRLGDEPARRTLAEALEHRERGIRLAASRWLVEIGDPKSLPAMEALVLRERKLRRWQAASHVKRLRRKLSPSAGT